MPLRDTAAMNASLDNDYGTTRGPHSPATHQMALFVGDPMTDGVELNSTDDPGYARPTVAAAGWAAAVAGFKSTDPAVQFANSTGPWLHEATHWALFDGATMWDCAPLVEPLAVTAAATGPKVVATIFYDDAVLNP